MMDLAGPVALLIGNEGNGVPVRSGGAGRRSRHDSLPRPGGEPECCRGRQRAAL